MKTPLYDRHLSLQATMIDFAGFTLPLHYGDPLLEWQSCRREAALFDVSHMGVIEIVGKGADLFLESLSVRTWKKRVKGEVIYTLLGHPEGGVQDDVLAYYFSPEKIVVVVNGARREADLRYFTEFAKGQFAISLRKETMILALQGPKTRELYSGFSQMKRMTFVEESEVLVSRSGYTGEDGIECIGETGALIPLFENWIKSGARPAGLNARDLLRQEMGYPLYGHELSLEIAAPSSIVSWAVEREKGYPGAHLQKKRQFAYGLIIDSADMIAREGATLFLNEEKIGRVTSGGFSPFLKKPIALVLSDQLLIMGDTVEVEVRGKRGSAKVVKPPFFSEEDKKRWLENIANPMSGSKLKG